MGYPTTDGARISCYRRKGLGYSVRRRGWCGAGAGAGAKRVLHQNNNHDHAGANQDKAYKMKRRLARTRVVRRRVGAWARGRGRQGLRTKQPSQRSKLNGGSWARVQACEHVRRTLCDSVCKIVVDKIVVDTYAPNIRNHVMLLTISIMPAGDPCKEGSVCCAQAGSSYFLVRN